MQHFNILQAFNLDKKIMLSVNIENSDVRHHLTRKITSKRTNVNRHKTKTTKCNFFGEVDTYAEYKFPIISLCILLTLLALHVIVYEIQLPQDKEKNLNSQNFPDLNSVLSFQNNSMWNFVVKFEPNGQRYETRENIKKIRNIAIEANKLYLNPPDEEDVISIIDDIYKTRRLRFFGVPGTKDFNDGLYYKLLVTPWFHNDWMHLMNNGMLMLGICYELEMYFGHISHLVIYILCSIVASITSMIALVEQHGEDAGIVVGASGAICGLSGSYLVYAIFQIRNYSKNIIYLLYTIGMSAFLVYSFYDTAKEIQQIANNGHQTSVDHFAHAGGAVAGIILALIYQCIRCCQSDIASKQDEDKDSERKRRLKLRARSTASKFRNQPMQPISRNKMIEFSKSMTDNRHQLQSNIQNSAINNSNSESEGKIRC